MYPLRYSQVFVPLLPAPLVHFVSMPLPFCVGMLTPQQERQEATVELLQPPGKSTSSSSNYRRRGGAPRGRPAPPAVYVCTLPDFSAAATSAATATAGTNSTSSNYNGNCTNTVSGNMLYAINMFAQSLDSFPLGSSRRFLIFLSGAVAGCLVTRHRNQNELLKLQRLPLEFSCC